MTNLTPPNNASRARLPYTRIIVFCTALAVAWWVWSSGVPGPDNQAAGAGSSEDVDADTRRELKREIERELEADQERHTALLERYRRRLRELKDADAKQSEIEAVERTISELRREYASRTRILERYLELADRPAPDVEEILEESLDDLRQSLRSIDQTFRIPPVVSPNARTGGTTHVDETARGERNP